jgi:SpoVK/Ycf46/Vps4 family AAA+-type ATPase
MDATWDDLVLPKVQRRKLDEIVSQVRQGFEVKESAGTGSRVSRGPGITALFAGPGGTGKTMAAELLANELHLNLCRIDLSQVLDKYIGETEKNLQKLFDAAEGGGAILFLDEADTLFGKRSKVKDSHDRYANSGASYLLQRMEGYRGLAILSTNKKEAIDAAFLRRLRFIVNFPFPSAEQRKEIWRRSFPPGVPTGELNFDKLAMLKASGSIIKDVALYAVFLSADEGVPVEMKHVLRGVRKEYRKLDMPLVESEIKGWIR